MDPHKQAELVRKTEDYARDYMSHYDCSHDYSHVQRVLRMAQHIAATEPQLYTASPRPSYDHLVVTLAALLHDIGDKKYLVAGVSGERLAAAFLLAAGAPGDLAESVQAVANGVSYSSEIANPEKVLELLARYPELGPVQDADRLDALGAVGIGRCFAFGGAKGHVGGLDTAVSHFGEKLLRLETMMKTETGREMARVRTERVRAFAEWWDDEVGPSSSQNENKA
ncbi:MAG: hypothetical protein M1832_000469 [Thelocarpon impressellum]|nr:MAG: hypothetical protein M1832_000469 [Thelocarpon impressellum]